MEKSVLAAGGAARLSPLLLMVIVAVISTLAACGSPALKPAAKAAQNHCSTTRNFQAPGPEPASILPRCVGSLNAGKLPGNALPPIIVAH